MELERMRFDDGSIGSVLSAGSSCRRVALCACVSLSLVVAEAAFAQTRVEPTRAGGATAVSSRPAGPRAPATAAGRGAALGDGNALGGQTFQWTRTTGAGQSLGGGNLLDANTQVGSGRSNNAATPVDYNARNLLVTGNVAGGRGFRGSVGYTADTDFRGRTGSDDTFNFEAGSAYSNVVFSSSAMSRDRFLTAQGLGAFEYRRESTPIGIQQQRAAMDQPDSRMRLDRANTAMSLGRLNYDAGEDRVVATGNLGSGESVRYIVSPLRGLQTEKLSDPVVQSGLGLYEQARARQEIALGLAKPEDFSPRARAIERGMLDTQLKPAESGQAPLQDNRMFAPGYLDILKSVDTATRRKTSDETATVDRVKSDLAEVERSRREAGRLPVMEEGTESREPATRPSTEPSREREPSDLERATDRIAPGAPQGARDPLLEPTSAEGEREREREKSRGKIMSVQEMAEVLRHGQTINTLASDDRRRLGELISLGQTALKAGDYFAAERRFIQAQDYRSGNPMIEVGMAHAQLGGGTYLSATLTLRQLFMSHPELIDTRYDRALLPSGERLDSAVKRIRERIALGEDRSDYGFLLAYIGHQAGDRALVEEGLREVAGTPSLETYGELLRGIWLGGK
jgi:hypothetical protein